ncbi:MAG: hypothetical protein Q8O67_32350 [Deltaproteobacteria bacterium]|nr:hypothetical protein [Deltaproteobacteria bacterium]
MSPEAELCRALLSACEREVPARRVAAALLLMELAHEDLELPLDDAPAAVRALLDAAR